MECFTPVTVVYHERITEAFVGTLKKILSCDQKRKSKDVFIAMEKRLVIEERHEERAAYLLFMSSPSLSHMYLFKKPCLRHSGTTAGRINKMLEEIIKKIEGSAGQVQAYI